LDLEMAIPKSLTMDRKERSLKTVILKINTTITLTREIQRVDIKTSIQNNALDHRLRVHFPAPFKTDEGWYDGHFEILKRPIRLPEWDETWAEEPRPEKPQRAFSLVRAGNTGLMLANRGLPEAEVLRNSTGNSEIALTLLRSVGWLSRDDFSTRRNHAGPFMETPGAQCQDTYSFDYAIIPLANDDRAFIAARNQAYAYNAPLRGLGSDLHPGSLPAWISMVRVDPDHFVISAIKACENQRSETEIDWIVRGYNPQDEAIKLKLKPWSKPTHAVQVNLNERPLKELELAGDGSVELAVRPYEILTIQFTNPINSIQSD